MCKPLDDSGFAGAAAAAAELRQLVFDNLPDGVCVADAAGRILAWNKAAEAITGFLRQEVVGRHCSDGLVSHGTLDGSGTGGGCPLETTLGDGIPREMRCYLRHKAGHPVAVRVRASAIRREGTVTGAVEVFEEDARLRRTLPLAGRLESRGLLDPLTGLPNHALIQMRLAERISEFPRYGVPFGLLLADIDRLEQINRACGRDAGDSMLRTVAEALLGGVTEQQLLGRWEEDKFLVVIDGCDPSTLRMVGERLRLLVEKSRIQWWGNEVRVTVSIGGVLIRPGEDEQGLMARAGRMLSAARGGGGNRVMLE